MSSAATVISFDQRRQQAHMNQRLAQNALILTTAIHDARLNREDLKLLARLLNMRVLYNQMRLRYDPLDRVTANTITKLQRAGYLGQAEVQELTTGFRRSGASPEPFWVFALSERELSRVWE